MLFNKLFGKKQPKVNNNFLWVIPRPSQVLTDAQQDINDTSTELTTEAVAQLLLQCGVCATPVSHSVGASVINYNFKLTNLKDYNKAKKAPEAMTARLQRKVSFDPNAVTGADFAIAIERKSRSTVYFSNTFKRSTIAKQNAHPTAFILGTDTQGKVLETELGDSMPHMLVAGQAGGGKSVLLHSIICSILTKASPACTRFIFIDPKMVELSQYAGIPHIYSDSTIAPQVITDVRTAVNTLAHVCDIMDWRYQQMSVNPNIKFSELVVVVDELADLMMMSKKQVEDSIVRICQKGRAAKIRILIATQSPRASVITGLIRANIPGKIALRCATAIDSRICIEKNGAEMLNGRGDALLLHPSNNGALIRFQAAYISPSEIQNICNWWRDVSRCKEYQSA